RVPRRSTSAFATGAPLAVTVPAIAQHAAAAMVGEGFVGGMDAAAPPHEAHRTHAVIKHGTRIGRILLRQYPRPLFIAATPECTDRSTLFSSVPTDAAHVPNVIAAFVGRAICNFKIQYRQESLSTLTESHS